MSCQRENYHTNILYAIQIILCSFKVTSTITINDKGVMPLERNSVGIQFYVNVENRDRINRCEVATWKNECCLKDDADENCDTMRVFGGYSTLGPQDADTLIFVYPTLYQHDQIGHCSFVLKYRCGRKALKTLIVNVQFDTTIVRSATNDFLSHYANGSEKSKCDSLDQDSLNDCEPIDCDLKYCGGRPFFDITKCVDASVCEADQEKDLPDVIYVPSTNLCRDFGQSLTVADIYAISTGIGTATESQIKEGVKVQLKSNCSTISQNLRLLRDLVEGNLCPVCCVDTTDYKECCKSAVLSIVSYIAGIICLVFMFICCLHSILWLHMNGKIEGIKFVLERFWSKFRAKAYSGDHTRVNSEVKNALLREVIVKDIPIELRDSIVEVCQRMDKKVLKKKRYRKDDIGSQISLCKAEIDTLTSDTSKNS